MRLTIPERKLTGMRRFVLEFAADGFNAYRQLPDRSFELFAASPKAVGSGIEDWNNNVLCAVLKTGVALAEAINEVTR